ncbi:MAG: quinolinate synthase NadA [Thermoplasmata archaeon]|nr:quinolinate synthase NadA [Thermoplasmata archaeon]MCI4359563.1 quinolinate synthase NadA [Thermoplasmata archaeon]
MSLESEVRRLKEDRQAVLLAHNYQVPEVQDAADYVGDSLYLSRKAAETDRPLIVFAGVRFMAETAKILNPTKTVLLPDLKAGCALADSITVEELRRWKSEHPGAAVVSYINTTAEVKAESDYICTSSNAARVVSSVPADQEILFLPDMFLGEHVRKVTGRAMHLWVGDCPVHAKMRPEDLERARAAHPGAEVVAHPECGCASAAIPNVDRILSTDGMVRFAEETRAPTVLVATEVGILHRMRRLNPRTEFLPISDGTICPYMKQIDLGDVLDSLALGRYEIEVPPETARRARGALERMIAS